MKNAFKLNSNLPPLSLPLKGGEQKRGLFHYNSNSSNSGFTLIELAIVVVVLGILIGGVVAGQSIIKSAKRSAVISEVKQMQMAVQAFKLEFDAYPGDMEEAYDYWGDDCGNDNNDRNNGCNGNSDRCVGVNESGVSEICPGTNIDFLSDQRRFFVHMNMSKIMSDIGYKNGFTDTGCEAGKDFPYSGYSDGTTYIVRHAYKRNELLMSYLDTKGFNYGGGTCKMHSLGNFPFHAREAEKIDKKIDDGKSNTGIVTNRISDCSNENGEYKIDLDENYCGLRIVVD